MMGTGKTAIMMNLNNHEEVAKRFDMVMWINVSAGESNENLDVSQLQKKIAKRLKVDREGANDSDDIAERISNELNGKRYLLLLDDIKANLDKHQMGIPPCENGSKIVLTTRENQILFPRVKFLKLTPLPTKESFRMFKIVANCPKFEDDREVGACVRRIVQECGGLPLLINIIASVFQKKDLKLWSEGLKSLERFSEKDCLLECWEAENFLGNGGDSRNAYMDGIYILKILKDKSLLEEHENPKYVMMHKCIRQILLHILSNDPNNKLLVQQMPPDAKCWSEKEWISLIEKFDKLPDRPNCGRLSTLFLQKNLALKSIPASFFDHMTSLKVLDLLHTGIELLPSSLSKVIELKVFYLDYCEYLKELLSSLEKLEHLEVLDIRGSGFSNIPSFIGKLKSPRHFQVSFAKCESENDTKEVEFNCNVISNFYKLEELIIDVKSERHQSNKVVVNIIKNVVTLKNLTKLQFCFLNEEVVDVIEVGTPATYLRINFPEADILYAYIEETRSWRSIQDILSFQFFIDWPNSIDPCIPKLEEYGRYVRYCNGEHINHPIFEVLANVDAFDLVNKKDIKHLSDLRIPSMKEGVACTS
ncbi:Disease resistance protein [Camellia lanceoleosa]|uniref:Disease resistance protein n=1 Tax=Camellia lanceoleosa TaxID=1840588 RepID=A0ACC0IQ43_9ERIC|nr:Disease resistance protein [Camellia lanceoleosa]